MCTMSTFSLKGRVALVTGVGSPNGIGLATARLLAEMGGRAPTAHGRGEGVDGVNGVAGDDGGDWSFDLKSRQPRYFDTPFRIPSFKPFLRFPSFKKTGSLSPLLQCFLLQHRSR